MLHTSNLPTHKGQQVPWPAYAERLLGDGLDGIPTAADFYNAWINWGNANSTKNLVNEAHARRAKATEEKAERTKARYEVSLIALASVLSARKDGGRGKTIEANKIAEEVSTR